jgi:hypothetical protein
VNVQATNFTPAGAGGSKPWLARNDWSAGEIRSCDKSFVFVFWIMGLAFCGFSTPFVFHVLRAQLHSGNKAIWLVLFFPIAGIYLLICAVYFTLRRLKYGSVVFKMGSVPGVIDGTLSGTIHVPGHFRPQDGVHLRLCCMHRYTSGSGSNRSTWEKILWEDEKTLGNNLPQTGQEQYELPVFFKIPADARPTDSSNCNDVVLWRLIAASRQPGVDFHSVFEVPVFKTEKSGDGGFMVTDTTTKYQIPFDPLHDAAALRIKVVDREDGSREFVLPATRNLQAKLGFSFFWLVLTGVCCLLVRLKTGGLMFLFLLLFYVVFGLFELLLTFICLDLWLRSSRIIATTGDLKILTHWLLLKRAQTIPAAQISGIKPASTMSAGETLYYDVQVATTDGKTVTAATAIRSKREAEWLAGQLSQALGLRQ